MNEKIACLNNLISESNNIVFFGGAGVSTESGIPDFRSKDGIYSKNYMYPPEIILSKDFFWNHTEEFFNFYKDNLNFLKFGPNITHKFLKKLEELGKLSAIITQNIDGLHQKAGSKLIYELHGTIYSNHCVKCNRIYGPDYVFKVDGIPRCACGGIIKPDVVLYGESLNFFTFNTSIYKSQFANLLLVAGSSLTVPPANTILNYFKGKHMVIINKDETPYDNLADLVIHDQLSNVISKINV